MESRLPEKLEKNDLKKIPYSWLNIAKDYAAYRQKAIKEKQPGYNTLLVYVLTALSFKDRKYIDEAFELVKHNIPEDIGLVLTGYTLCTLNYTRDGLEKLREACKVNPLPINMIALATKTEDITEMIELSEKVLKINPEEVDALRNLAFGMFKRKEYIKAEEIVAKALLIDYKNKLARSLLGDIYFEQRRFKDALKEYKKARSFLSMPINLKFRIARCLYHLDRIKEAAKIALAIKGQIAEDEELSTSPEMANEILEEIIRARE
jgi:tetratricopeptide (TPR) repeat protein